MTDLELGTRMAEEYGIEIEKKFIPFSGRRFAFYPTQLLAFEQAVLAKRDEEWRKQIAETSNTEIESLKAKLAMQAALLDDIQDYVSGARVPLHPVLQDRLNNFNATQADVDNWLAKKKAEWEKGVLEEASEVCAKESEGAYKLKGTKDWYSYNEGIGDGW